MHIFLIVLHIEKELKTDKNLEFQEEKLEEEIDLVDKLLQKSGCEEQHYK